MRSAAAEFLRTTSHRVAQGYRSATGVIPDTGGTSGPRGPCRGRSVGRPPQRNGSIGSPVIRCPSPTARLHRLATRRCLPSPPRCAAAGARADAAATSASAGRCSAPDHGPPAAPSAPVNPAAARLPAIPRSVPRRPQTDRAVFAFRCASWVCSGAAGWRAIASADPPETPPALGSPAPDPPCRIQLPGLRPAHRWPRAPAGPGSGGSSPAATGDRFSAAAPAAGPSSPRSPGLWPATSAAVCAAGGAAA